MTELIRFKLVFKGATHRFASTQEGETLYRAVRGKVASIVGHDGFELFWKDDDSEIVLELPEDLSTAIDYAKWMRTNPAKPPCVQLVVVEPVVAEVQEAAAAVVVEEKAVGLQEDSAASALAALSADVAAATAATVRRKNVRIPAYVLKLRREKKMREQKMKKKMEKRAAAEALKELNAEGRCVEIHSGRSAAEPYSIEENEDAVCAAVAAAIDGAGARLQELVDKAAAPAGDAAATCEKMAGDSRPKKKATRKSKPIAVTVGVATAEEHAPHAPFEMSASCLFGRSFELKQQLLKEMQKQQLAAAAAALLNPQSGQLRDAPVAVTFHAAPSAVSFSMPTLVANGIKLEKEAAKTQASVDDAILKSGVTGKTKPSAMPASALELQMQLVHKLATAAAQPPRFDDRQWAEMELRAILQDHSVQSKQAKRVSMDALDWERLSKVDAGREEEVFRRMEEIESMRATGPHVDTAISHLSKEHSELLQRAIKNELLKCGEPQPSDSPASSLNRHRKMLEQQLQLVQQMSAAAAHRRNSPSEINDQQRQRLSYALQATAVSSKPIEAVKTSLPAYQDQIDDLDEVLEADAKRQQLVESLLNEMLLPYDRIPMSKLTTDQFFEIQKITQDVLLKCGEPRPSKFASSLEVQEQHRQLQQKLAGLGDQPIVQSLIAAFEADLVQFKPVEAVRMEPLDKDVLFKPDFDRKKVCNSLLSRKQFSLGQESRMEELFKRTHTQTEKEELAEKIGLSIDEVNEWFFTRKLMQSAMNGFMNMRIDEPFAPVAVIHTVPTAGNAYDALQKEGVANSTSSFWKAESAARQLSSCSTRVKTPPSAPQVVPETNSWQATRAEEMRKEQKEVADRIPTDKAELFSFPLRRAYLKGEAMGKVRSWVAKKIKELIGEEDETLIDYICEKIDNGETPTKLQQDLQMILDNDAEAFVIKLWRIVVYESESAVIRSRGVSQGLIGLSITEHLEAMLTATMTSTTAAAAVNTVQSPFEFKGAFDPPADSLDDLWVIDAAAGEPTDPPPASDDYCIYKTAFTPDQKALLEQRFAVQQRPAAAAIRKLALVLASTKEHVGIWFKYRRAQERFDQEQKEVRAASLRSCPVEATVIAAAPQPAPVAHVAVEEKGYFFDSDDEENSIEMTYKEKRGLMIGVQKLPGNKLPGIVKIIEAREPLLNCNYEEEELDLEVLSAKTLREMEAYVNFHLKREKKTKINTANCPEEDERRKRAKAALHREFFNVMREPPRSSGYEAMSATDANLVEMIVKDVEKLPLFKETSNPTLAEAKLQTYLISHFGELYKTSVARAAPAPEDQTEGEDKKKEEENCMTYEEKRRLALEINSLTGAQLTELVAIIETCEEIAGINPNEIEVDFENLSIATLREVETFVADCLKKTSANDEQLRVASTPAASADVEDAAVEQQKQEELSADDWEDVKNETKMENIDEEFKLKQEEKDDDWSKQALITPEQESELEKRCALQAYPFAHEKKELAAELSLTIQQVEGWFSRRQHQLLQAMHKDRAARTNPVGAAAEEQQVVSPSDASDEREWDDFEEEEEVEVEDDQEEEFSYETEGDEEQIDYFTYDDSAVAAMQPVVPIIDVVEQLQQGTVTLEGLPASWQHSRDEKGLAARVEALEMREAVIVVKEDEMKRTIEEFAFRMRLFEEMMKSMNGRVIELEGQNLNARVSTLEQFKKSIDERVTELEDVKTDDLLAIAEMQLEKSMERLRLKRQVFDRAQLAIPGDIITQPGFRIVFNGIFSDFRNTYSMKIINTSSNRIGWIVKSSNPDRIVVKSATGVLDAQADAFIPVTCNFFEYTQSGTKNDRLIVEWTNVSMGADKQFKREWFEGGGMIRRKELKIEYNL